MNSNKIHTTNYQNTFILVAVDCPAIVGEMPPIKDNKKTIANIQFEKIYENPYIFDSDHVLFDCFAQKNEVPLSELEEAKTKFFSKGQACMRSSPLTKRYGWGVHANAEGKIAIYGCETEEYKKLANDSGLKVVNAMRSGKK